MFPRFPQQSSLVFEELSSKELSSMSGCPRASGHNFKVENTNAVALANVREI